MVARKEQPENPPAKSDVVSSEFLSRYFEIELHPLDNLDELEYREKIQPQEEMYDHPQKWIRHMRKEKLKMPSVLKKKGIEFRGSILEIGAGSCWLSAVLSRFHEVKEIYALDFSRDILKKVAPAMMNHLNANTRKIIRVRGSFYNLIPLNTQFDFVVSDGALHHTKYPTAVLNQISKVLKLDGSFVCVREPLAPKLPILRSITKRKFGTHERKYGVTENIYTLNEWREIFQKGGFEFGIVRYSLRLPPKKLLANVRARLPNARLLKIIYGIDSMPVAFIGKKRAKG